MISDKSNGEVLKQLREQLGLSQEQLAEKLQVRQKTVSDWETGKMSTKWIDRARALFDLLDEAGINVKDLPDDLTQKK